MISARDADGRVVASSRDPFRRDAKNSWWFDENGGNDLLEVPGPPGRLTMMELRLHFVCVPMWFFVALPLVPVAVLRARETWVRRRRERGGLCAACGYDLRATPGRCPECGTPANGGTAASGEV